MSDWHLFEAVGVELEYMIVHKETLDVYPIADRIIEAVAGSFESEIELGDIAWSNELVLHVIEMKTNGPVSSLNGLAQLFSEHVDRLNSVLKAFNGCLMPTAAHPWMNPLTETQLWPHECGPIYQTYNRIFDCRGHGWSNLQSTHLNLPFHGDDEFGRLHAAIRLLMPVMPALTASSPLFDGAAGSHLDGRMKYYCTNAALIPQVAGKIIPEAVFSQEEYRKNIFEPMFQAIAPLDPEGILTHEFLNSRGAIARFERGAIEIRILDIQETPAADLATAQLIISILSSLTKESSTDYITQKTWPLDPLVEIFQDVIKEGDQAVISDPGYLQLFGLKEKRISALELWNHLAECCPGRQDWDPALKRALALILKEGPLARRIVNAVNNDFRHDNLQEVYTLLCNCLDEQKMFLV